MTGRRAKCTSKNTDKAKSNTHITGTKSGENGQKGIPLHSINRNYFPLVIFCNSTSFKISLSTLFRSCRMFPKKNCIHPSIRSCAMHESNSNAAHPHEKHCRIFNSPIFAYLTHHAGYSKWRVCQNYQRKFSWETSELRRFKNAKSPVQ